MINYTFSIRKKKRRGLGLNRIYNVSILRDQLSKKNVSPINSSDIAYYFGDFVIRYIPSGFDLFVKSIEVSTCITKKTSDKQNRYLFIIINQKHF